MSTALKRIVVGFGMALAVVSGTAFVYLTPRIVLMLACLNGNC